ncbi:hypothetical protein ACIP79_16605 [Streptomyces sp. NPDC088747]|uniref:hypothetical protein n=1 Tax=Streptomyces sp. NPDC088747 TaxID=3365886 RepID=UPI00382E3BDB
MRTRLRLRTSLPLSVTAAAAALPLTLATPGTARAEPSPICAATESRAFPVETRIHGGPARYDVGGGFGTWYIDLTNTTAQTCQGIHPVVVLVDEKRALRPEQARLEFYEGAGAEQGGTEAPHPVEFEKTDEDENVGAFDGFPGFTVGPGRTLTVKVRLSVTSDAAVPNDVVANAAVVQRHDDDGDWVGESNDYRFRIADEDADEGEAEDEGESEAEGTGEAEGRGDGERDREGAGEDAGGASTGGAGTGGVGGDGGVVGEEEGAAPAADELASTGPRASRGLGLAAGALLSGTGVVLLVASRRARARARVRVRR